MLIAVVTPFLGIGVLFTGMGSGAPIWKWPLPLGFLVASILGTLLLITADRWLIRDLGIPGDEELEPAYLWALFVALIPPLAVAVYLWKRGKFTKSGSGPFWTYTVIVFLFAVGFYRMMNS